MGDDQPLISVELPDDAAAKTARRAVAGTLSDLRARDRADALLLVSELVGLVGGNNATRILHLRRDSDGVWIEVHGDTVVAPASAMVAGLFDRLAAQWFLSERAGGFLVDNPHALEPDADEEMLLRRAAAGDAPAKSALVERYRGFAYSLTRKYLRSGTNREDMEQVAAIALVKALDRFDPDRGVKFTTFAAQTVDGELKRFIRDAGWSLRVPRGLQELGLEARQASAELSQRMGGEPTLKDVAAAVDKDVDEVGAALLARESFDAASLDAPAGGAEAPPLADALPDHDQRLVMAPEWSDLSLVLDDLPERERRILFLRFFKDLSQAEIAQIMGISQMHVSRLLARSIEDLRLWIGLTTERDG